MPKTQSAQVSRRQSYLLQKSERRIVVCGLSTYSVIGGLQNFNRRVIEVLAKRAASHDGEKPLVLFLNDKAEDLPKATCIEFEVYRNRIIFTFRSIFSALASADIFILCHVHLVPFAAVVRLFRPNLPILLFVHGDEVWIRPRVRNKRWYESWCLGAVTRIAAVSDFTANRMACGFGIPQSKFRILPNAVDSIDGGSNECARDRATILTVNRIGPYDREKNVDQMIRAVARLRKSVPDLRYLIVGDGALRPELEALSAELGVADIVKFCGWVGQAELRTAYEQATVFAMPSSKEGFGIVYLEAWQRGLPVICSKAGASSEVVTDGVDGFVVDPADISMICDRLQTLLSRPELCQAMSVCGRRKVEAKYLHSAFEANLNAILDDLILPPAPERPALF